MSKIKKGYADVLIGLQFGDEGKARVVDMIASKYDIIARFNGGANAGHTIENEKGKVALKQIPSGIFYPKKQLYIGSGCVVNLVKLASEIAMVESLGISLTNRLHVTCQASIIQPHHILLDEYLGGSVGTTKNGIGPAYADKATRMMQDRLVNIRIADLIDNPAKYFPIIKKNLDAAIALYQLQPTNTDTMITELKKALTAIQTYVELDPLYLQKAVESGATVLFEGAQSSMLDVSRGSIPYVTSSNTIASSAYVGGDLSPNYHRKTIGVIKAVMSRVGYGPFPSELGGKKSEEYCMSVEKGLPKYTKQIEKTYNIDNYLSSADEFKIGVALRILSGEYGTVTTRPRRIGILDLVQLTYITKMNAVDELIINKCDMLQAYIHTAKKKIPLVTEYTLDNKTIDYFPSSTDACYRIKPTITYLEGFSKDVSTITTPEKLPSQLKKLIEQVEKSTKTRVLGIGVGPERNQFVYM